MISHPKPFAAGRKGCRDFSKLNSFVELVSGGFQAWQSHPDNDLRLELREEFPESITVLPVDEKLSRAGTKFTTMARDLSHAGIGFYHESPISAPLVIIQFAGVNDQAVLTRLVSCRFQSNGSYVSGGHFLRALDCRRLV